MSYNKPVIKIKRYRKPLIRRVYSLTDRLTNSRMTQVTHCQFYKHRPIQEFGWCSLRRTSTQRSSWTRSRWTHVQLAVSSLPISATTADRHSFGLDVVGHLSLSMTSSPTPHSLL